ncbi:MAG: hypothetical protein LQ350_005071 [Teloschistes chrysophthalmus]|nr:MAG: hypothetical protein LQ350_005071 [Niorma chrysophthalma]
MLMHCDSNHNHGHIDFHRHRNGNLNSEPERQLCWTNDADGKQATASTKTTTAATITNTVTVTVTASATFTAQPSTTTTTITTTATSAPQKVCSDDISAAQRKVTGVVASTSSQVATPSRIDSAETCYTYCRNLKDPYNPSNTTPRAKSYTFKQSADPAMQNTCVCYTNQICNFVTPDANGDVLAGDTAVPF